MAWSRDEFLNILETDIAQKIFTDPYIASYTKNWSQDNKAALLYANNINKEMDPIKALACISLVAAFGKKDIERIENLIYKERVSVGVRLDYFLPLYDIHYEAGEDIFVVTLKHILDKTLRTRNIGKTMHFFAPKKGNFISAQEVGLLQAYVASSEKISTLLHHAPNKTMIMPNVKALEYILNNAASYQDSNGNPVIVFLPGIISVPGYEISTLIDGALLNGADINAKGWLGVTGIVWSIILGDVNAVNHFIAKHAELTNFDNLGNPDVNVWVDAVTQSVQGNPGYLDRLRKIKEAIGRTLSNRIVLKVN